MVLTLALVQFTTPNGDRIDINSAEITSLREPHGSTEMHWAQGTRCIIVMSNGKFIAVHEDCSSVRKLLGGGGPAAVGHAPCIRVCGEVTK